MKQRWMKFLHKLAYWFWNKSLWGAIMIPISFVVQIIVGIKSYCTERKKLAAYTIVVGNPNIGGSGKTPFVIWLVKILQQKGKKVGVITRGYKSLYLIRQPYVAEKSYNPYWLGDEGALIGEHCQCPVAAYSDRYKAAVALLKAYKCEILIFDDGLQYSGIEFSLKICLFDFKNALGNGFTIPGGPLRAPLATLENMDFILNTGAKEPAFEKVNYPFVYHAVSKEEKMLSSFKKCTIILGLAHPETVIYFVKKHCIDLETVLLPDHELCSPELIEEILKKSSVIMTEKDWIKLKNYFTLDDDIWVLPLTLNVHQDIAASLLKTIRKGSRREVLERTFL
jgi:tetraacyldisaccharide 4'-kinase